MIGFFIALVLIGFIFVFTYGEYSKVFNIRGKESTDFCDYFLARLPTLKAEPFTFLSGKETLAGMRFSYTVEPKALLVMVHGYGWNMEDYFPQAELFARQGYLVLIFDGMGIGRSSGASIHGLPQHMLDAAAMLDYVAADATLAALPLLLYGHSWGGYAADAVHCGKRYPVRAIVSVSAYNEPLAVMEKTLQDKYGWLSRILIVPPVIFQRLAFGKAANYSAVRGLGQVDCPVLVVHSRGDTMLPFAGNYQKIYDAHRDKSNFCFIPLEGENHNIGIPHGVNERRIALQRELRKAEEKEALSAELWAVQMVIDEEMLGQFAAFFEESLQKGDAEV